MFTKMMKKRSLLVLMCLLLLFQSLSPLPVLADPPINMDKVDPVLLALIDASDNTEKLNPSLSAPVEDSGSMSKGDPALPAQVEVSDKDRDNHDHERDDNDKHDFHGFVESMPKKGRIGTWVVSGRKFNTTADTKFKETHGALEVGAYVKVKYDDVNHATKIETKNDVGDGDDDDEGDDDEEEKRFSVIVCIESPAVQDASADVNAERAQQALREIERAGGEAGNTLAIIGGASGEMTAKAIARLSHRSNVSYISYDAPVTVQGPLGAPLESLYTQLVRAPEVWDLGYTGQGVTVAVLDSGIAPVADLTQPSSRIVTAVDFVDSPAGVGDPGGHGTHVAGIIAGNGTDSAGGYQGIAPEANLIDVRVLNEGGTASMSTVIGGIQWVVNHKSAYNIRVLNISLGTTAYANYRLSPLASAVEMAWFSGIVVVTSAGNSGPLPTTVSSPADDPFVISVGCLDDNQTLDPLDDLIPDFSAHGPTLYGHVKPDLVAPGRKVISLRSPGSYLDELLPERRVGESYFRLTGTSMSTPVVSGIVALMLERNPGLKPNQVKNILRQTTYAIPYDENIAGTGVVDAYAAVTSDITERTNFGLTPSDDFARDILPLVRGAPLFWRWPNYGGINWSNISWDNISWDRTTWENFVWENISWDNISWDTDCTWDNISWDSSTWDAAEADNAADADSYGWLSLRDLD